MTVLNSSRWRSGGGLRSVGLLRLVSTRNRCGEYANFWANKPEYVRIKYAWCLWVTPVWKAALQRPSVATKIVPSAYSPPRVMSNTRGRRRRDATVKFSCVGVGGVYWALVARAAYNVKEWTYEPSRCPRSLQLVTDRCWERFVPYPRGSTDSFRLDVPILCSSNKLLALTEVRPAGPRLATSDAAAV